MTRLFNLEAQLDRFLTLIRDYAAVAAGQSGSKAILGNACSATPLLGRLGVSTQQRIREGKRASMGFM